LGSITPAHDTGSVWMHGKRYKIWNELARNNLGSITPAHDTGCMVKRYKM